MNSGMAKGGILKIPTQDSKICQNTSLESSETTPLRKFCQKIADFTGNLVILLAIFGNFGNLKLIIDYLGLNKPNKPKTRVLEALISEETALPVAIFGRHLALKYHPPPIEYSENSAILPYPNTQWDSEIHYIAMRQSNKT